MIAANELRVYNWIYDTDLNKNVQVCSINTDCTGNPKVNNNDLRLQYNPIEITPELLQQCGFQLVTMGQFKAQIFNRLYSLHFDDGFVVTILMQPDKNIIIYIKDKYNSIAVHYTVGNGKDYALHQLQNLIFAFTGHDLQITL